ncbi:MAG: radical SAM protein [Deltaproteobacteria bacterium]
MRISEIFLSIQGESTYAGLPCVFVRFAGCNLSCAWCDSGFARTIGGARELSADEVLSEVRRFSCRLAEITGGEPLLQDGSRVIMQRLLDDGYVVLLETNGTVSLAGLDRRLVKIVDVKCPSSGHAGSFLIENLGHLLPDDEVKFVIGGRVDYEFARDFVERYLKDRTLKILFAPVKTTLKPDVLAEWILKDGLSVRLQLQLHSYIWPDQRGR